VGERSLLRDDNVLTRNDKQAVRQINFLDLTKHF